MRVKPNRTELEGIVTDIHADAGGIGFELSLEVAANSSQAATSDFIRAKPGETVQLFCLKAPTGVEIGDEVRVEAELLAGPGGGRIVLQRAEKR
jgi:hypothetical protein